jgi:7-carboxy-7-deazaguanine synthase
MTLDAILEQVGALHAAHVCVTGGEPLAQANCLPLLTRLCDAGYFVSLETSGALSVAEVDPRVARVVDVKTPASGEVERNLLDQLTLLRGHDQDLQSGRLRVEP